MELPIHFYRTTTGIEVDFLVGESLAIEVKATKMVHERDLKALHAARDDISLRRRIVVSFDKEPRRLGNVEVIPVDRFFPALWGDDIVTSNAL